MGEVRRGLTLGCRELEGRAGGGRKLSRRYLRFQPDWLARPLSSEPWSLTLCKGLMETQRPFPHLPKSENSR